METVIRNVGEIDSHDRRALEHVLGQSLRDNQQLVIRILNLQTKPAIPKDSTEVRSAAKLPDWCNVYAGLSDEEISDLEKTILTRADLGRPSE